MEETLEYERRLSEALDANAAQTFELMKEQNNKIELDCVLQDLKNEVDSNSTTLLQSKEEFHNENENSSDKAE
jgi:hypothetical protein